MEISHCPHCTGGVVGGVAKTLVLAGELSLLPAPPSADE